MTRPSRRTVTLTLALPATAEGLPEECRPLWQLAQALPERLDLREAPPDFALGLLALVGLWLRHAQREG